MDNPFSRRESSVPEKKSGDRLRKQALLTLARSLHNVSKACKILEYSRDTYYRLLKSSKGGEIRLNFAKAPPRRQLSRANLEKRKEMESLVLGIRAENPGLGKYRIARLIQEKGIYLSPSGVYNILKRSPRLGPGSTGRVSEEK